MTEENAEKDAVNISQITSDNIKGSINGSPLHSFCT